MVIGWSNTYGQQSLDLFSNAQPNNSKFRLNSFESDPANFSLVKDWQLSASFSGVNDKNLFSTNLFSISVGKQIGANFLYARYTPGYFKEFVVNSGIKILVRDTIPIGAELKTKIRYEEKFGLGYSYSLNKNISFGFSFRYFQQEFREDQPNPFFSDTLNFISTKTVITNNNFWRGDFGIGYNFTDNFMGSLSSINLLLLNENKTNEIAKRFSLRNEKGALLQLKYQPNENLLFNFGYETNSSFIGTLGFSRNLLNGKIFIGASFFHDKYQNPFIAGIQPEINFSTALFNISLTGVKYFSDRASIKSVTEFEQPGIYNLTNNSFSYDRVIMNISLAFSFSKQQLVKFLDVEIKEEIFPTLSDKYLYTPFAVARVINLSEKPVEVKPYSLIANLNPEAVFSPGIVVAANDTTLIPFFTIIDLGKFKSQRREISQADFFLSTESSQTEDFLQKPILINDINSWDGKVANLHYFVKRDFDFSSSYAKSVLQKYKNELEETLPELKIFAQTKILFNEFVKTMVYVADPRASVDRVQFPNETLQLKGGDCDDLSVLLSSLLESIGIQTAFVDYKNESGVGHVNLLVNTQLKPEQSNFITNNDKKIVIRKNGSNEDEIWIPIEATLLKSFDSAWSAASEKFEKEALEEFGLAKNNVEIIDIN